jgi:hypothetical protein
LKLCRCQPTAFLIGDANPALHVRTEDAVFFDQARQGLLLPLVEPADQRLTAFGATRR